jgi:hypothetical protein
MTTEEFNEQYKDLIEPGFEDQGLMLKEEKIVKLLDEWFQGLIENQGMTFQYSQIKFKFGTCRIYMDGVDQNEVWKMEKEINKLL